jgi:hypothetical protein
MPTWSDVVKIENLRAEHNLRGMRSYAIQSQFSASKNLLQVAKVLQDSLSCEKEINLFYAKFFDILTSEGIGLDNWGKILGITRIISDEGITLNLDDSLYRLLLLYKAMANISASKIDSLNQLLKTLCDSGIGNLPKRAYVLEIEPMVIRWIFEDYLSAEQLAVFKAAGILAKPAGVGFEWFFVNPNILFGFDGSGLNPFNQAPFRPDNSLIERKNDNS